MSRLQLVQPRAESFSGEDAETPIPGALTQRIRRTMTIGAAVVGFLVGGLVLWAVLSPVSGAVSAGGVIKVENNRKSVKRLEPGIIRKIYVREGDTVKAGQLLLDFDDTQTRAQLAELQSAYDSTLAERARYEAEATGKATVTFPQDLLTRRSDPQVGAQMSAQQALFQARRQSLVSQAAIGRQRAQELGSQISGVNAQIASVDAQLSLNAEELSGVQALYAGGYAPKTRLLGLQRSAAGLAGNRGEQVASIARTRQAIGETALQVLLAKQAVISEAAAGLESSSDKLAALGARLASAKDLLSHTQVRSPADGTVLNLTQFTEGAPTGSGEQLLDIVPTGQPLVIQAHVEPRDAHAVRPGQAALVTLTAYNSRTTPRINARVVTLSADQTIDPHTGKGFFTVELRIPPDQLRRLPPTVKIYPGMPVQASIVNGQRSVMSYLIGPITDIFTQSMHEQ